MISKSLFSNFKNDIKISIINLKGPKTCLKIVNFKNVPK